MKVLKNMRLQIRKCTKFHLPRNAAQNFLSFSEISAILKMTAFCLKFYFYVNLMSQLFANKKTKCQWNQLILQDCSLWKYSQN